MSESLLRLAQGLSDEEFERWYGPVSRLTPSDAAALMDGVSSPWWVVGGWSIEAIVDVGRPHEDLDIGVLQRDVPAVVRHFMDSHHVWATGGGVMCPLLSPAQELPPWMHQLWVREGAGGPWLLDFIVAADRDGEWVFQRDPSVVAAIEDVTWVAGDGVRYQRPEVTLAFKAAHQREKDEVDFEAALPRLDPAARTWLGDTIGRLHPQHDWLARLT